MQKANPSFIVFIAVQAVIIPVTAATHAGAESKKFKTISMFLPLYFRL
jgi:hypothetical protein